MSRLKKSERKYLKTNLWQKNEFKRSWRKLVLAHRRACEEYLRAGRITVNGQVVELGAKADPAKDEICLDRKPVQTKTESIYIALNKPRQVLSAIHQDDDRKDVLASGAI